ncbi:5'-AMP-activated protein kinase beta subunit, interation domain-containing protein [Terfezia claveryi]|nr:5'-AMP-activated protein kinase beta subunit, interation domain-containing protein [Terfezia claveryi]
MGNNPSRAQHQPHSHHHLLQPHGAAHQGQGPPSPLPSQSSNTCGTNCVSSPQRSPAVQAARRGSLPHTPSPTSTKNYQGLYPIRVTHEQPTVQGGDHAFFDPRGLLPDLSGFRRGSTGGVDIGSRVGAGGPGGVGRGPEHYGTVAADGIYGAGLPPQFKNLDPFRTGLPNKAQSFIAEEPLEPAGMSGLGAEELQRRGSIRSTTTVEDDETVDESRSIPTLVTWTDGGNKVYITGTFCGWRKKYRLTKGPESKILSAIVPLPAGTHHVKFLVDGELRTSDTLPTAVDSTGILVNYLEVNADDMLTSPLERQPSPDHTEHPSPHQQYPSAIPQSEAHRYPSPAQAPQPQRHHGQPHTHSTLSADEQFTFTRPRPQRYTDTIPAYLRDFEENQERYVVTSSVVHGSDRGESGGLVKVPPPPTLPLMLGKVILNSSSHLKDDNSVLGIPNHVVLNHLATSSIKNHVLAVSATTRYKKKYVSTILYKATTE